MYRKGLEWFLQTAATAAVAAGLLKLFFGAQKMRRTGENARPLWMRIVFWTAWALSFLISVVLLVLMILTGISLYQEGDFLGTWKMMITVLLIVLCICVLFVYPVMKHRNQTDDHKEEP